MNSAKLEISLWAKSSGQGRYHPLLWHCMDAACITEMLWREAHGSELCRRLGEGLNLNDTAIAAWAPLLVALHDLGKASPTFQAKDEALGVRLADLGLGGMSAAQNGPHHALYGAAVLPAILSKPRPGWTPLDAGTANLLGQLLGGHHGVFPSCIQIEQASEKISVLELGWPAWAHTRQTLVDELTTLWLPAGLPAPAILDLFSPDHAALMILAGLVTVADWLASCEDFFPFRPEITDPQEYLVLARRQAARAVDQVGWDRLPPPDAPRSFVELFPATGGKMRPAQARVGGLAHERAQPRLVVLEVPMGEGKTEAALLLADRWRTALFQRGAYLALPTMATSNQMFLRLMDFLQVASPGVTVNLHLLHSHAMLSDAYQALRLRAVAPDGARHEEAALVAGEWFARPKRGLLAPYAVGTVDQALLAVLQTRHGFVRLFGLAGKTVILDEVHAYDAYMNTLLERLLAWLARLGSTVVILSATLPRRRLAALLAAYGGQPVSIATLPVYPRLNWLAGDGTIAGESVPASRAWSLNLHWVEDDLPARAAGLAALLAGGGCAAWICNTVGRAQAVYAALREQLAGTGIELDLFHARYPFNERERRERRCLEQYGKDGRYRPAAAILVATQVIEQSLDLDFDLMLTELAPVDLVLQRAGRLHRHARPRPASLSEPLLLVLKPAGHDAGNPALGRSVYDEWVLLRSWLALRERSVIDIPGDVEDLIESVYGERPLAVPESLRERLEVARVASGQAQRDMERQARSVALGAPDDENLLDQWNRELDEDRPDLHPSLQALTRLSGPTISLVCLHEVDGRICLDAAGRRPVELDRMPDLPAAKALLGAALTVSYRGCVADFPFESLCPPAWRRSALLHQHRAVVFHDGQYEAVLMHLGLDPELGLVLERKIKRGGTDEPAVQPDY